MNPAPALDADARARALGMSRAALDLYAACDVIDLHVDSFIWTRVFGYDLRARHGRGLFGGNFLSQVDSASPRACNRRFSGRTARGGAPLATMGDRADGAARKSSSTRMPIVRSLDALALRSRPRARRGQ